MGVDTSIQYNGYNSYKFGKGDLLACYPFGVESMKYITHSFGAYSPIALGESVRAITKFFNANSEIIQTIDHSFGIGQGAFEKKEISIPVPVGAIKAQLMFLNNESDPWWVATPKTEEGQSSTPYIANLYGQLTYFTPNGIYTGKITASQIVLASNDETLEERLDTTLKEGVSYAGSKITAEGGFENTAIIDGQTVKVVCNAQEGFSIYVNGKFAGGISIIGGKAALTAERIATDENYYGEVGTVDGVPGFSLYDLLNGPLPYFRVMEVNKNGFIMYDKNHMRFAATDQFTGLYDQNGEPILLSNSDFAILYDNDGNQRAYFDNIRTRLSFPGNGGTGIEISDGKVEIYVNGYIKETWT